MFRKIDFYIGSLLVIGMLLAYPAVIGAQTLPDSPYDDTVLVDPDKTEFSEDTFSDDFSSVIGGDDLLLDADDTTTTTTTTTTDSTTDTTAVVTPEVEPATTTVEDTPTGPNTVYVFWITFIMSFGLLQIIRLSLKREY